MFLSCSSVRASVSQNTVNAIILQCLTHCHQIYTLMYYGTEVNALNFGGQKVTVQGHGGITYAELTVTAQAEAYCTEYSTSHVE